MPVISLLSLRSLVIFDPGVLPGLHCFGAALVLGGAGPFGGFCQTDEAISCKHCYSKVTFLMSLRGGLFGGFCQTDEAISYKHCFSKAIFGCHCGGGQKKNI